MPANTNHTVLIIPGLGDDQYLSIPILNQATSHWKNKGFSIIIHRVHWRDGKTFEMKLSELLNLIDSIGSTRQISLVGTSAGASLALNAFLERPFGIHRVVNVCGRLRSGNHRLRSLERMARTSRAFHQSVLQFEDQENKLTKEQRVRIMTIRPFFGDELVPSDTVPIKDADNKIICTGGHMASIYFSLRFSTLIPTFLSH